MKCCGVTLEGAANATAGGGVCEKFSHGGWTLLLTPCVILVSDLDFVLIRATLGSQVGASCRLCFPHHLGYVPVGASPSGSELSVGMHDGL